MNRIRPPVIEREGEKHGSEKSCHAEIEDWEVVFPLALALLLSLCMMPSLAFATSGTEVDKTADAKLDDKYQANVTLTVDGTSTQTHSDEVFVLDKSTSIDVRREAGMLLEELMKQAGDNKTKVGVVVLTKAQPVKSN